MDEPVKDKDTRLPKNKAEWRDGATDKPAMEGPSVEPAEEEGSSATRPGRRPGKLDESGGRMDEQ